METCRPADRPRQALPGSRPAHCTPEERLRKGRDAGETGSRPGCPDPRCLPGRKDRGVHRVLSPSLPTYLLLVAQSEKTPVTDSVLDELQALLGETVSSAIWGEESLKGDTEGTSPDNETSVVQFADVCGKKVLLTGAASVQAVTEAHQAASRMGIATSPLDWFHVPHHGSRRNLSSCSRAPSRRSETSTCRKRGILG